MANTTPVPLPSPIPPYRFRKALEVAQPAMAALAESQLIDIALDIPAAVALVLRVVETEVFREARAHIAEQLPKFDLTNYDRLADYALATAQAETELRATSRSQEYQASLISLGQTRELLKSDIEALARRNLVDGSRLSELRSPNGHSNLAYDVLLCCTILRSHWGAISGRTAVTLDELSAAEQLGERMVEAVALRDQISAAPAAMLDRRARAYTVLLKAYAEVRRAFTYLRAEQGDVDLIIPSLYTSRGGGRPPGKKEEGAAPEGATLPTEGQVASPSGGTSTASSNGNGANGNGANGNGANGNGAAKPAPANGMPDEDPFAKG